MESTEILEITFLLISSDSCHKKTLLESPTIPLSTIFIPIAAHAHKHPTQGCLFFQKIKIFPQPYRYQTKSFPIFVPTFSGVRSRDYGFAPIYHNKASKIELKYTINC